MKAYDKLKKTVTFSKFSKYDRKRLKSEADTQFTAVFMAA